MRRTFGSPSAYKMSREEREWVTKAMSLAALRPSCPRRKKIGEQTEIPPDLYLRYGRLKETP